MMGPRDRIQLPFTWSPELTQPLMPFLGLNLLFERD